ncbi:MAG TPA: tyrosine-type recombinase/integrase [Chthonomonas sp.]|uniref:tyrosine-type recombinase/integrase n=1 Tax=Chthonomonas sp. TaxID=2282153 RepID=UPI002B4B25AF|nr:tyrosine-type recombinase/integrase [Chthonomonas sp.]HLI47276.1 tyrosine-type recombinase/integrase [Chthonomonas sp.]
MLHNNRNTLAALAKRVDVTLKESLSIEAAEAYFQSFLYTKQISGVSDNTLDCYKRSFKTFLRFAKEHERDRLNTETLKAFFAYLQRKGLKPWTVNSRYTALRSFVSYLLEEGELDVDILEGVPRPIIRQDEIAPFTEDEVMRLLEAAKQTRHAERNYALLCLLLDTGMRISEALNLNVDDINIRTREVFIRHGKGNKGRVVPISPRCYKALVSYIKTREGIKDDDPLFVTERGTRFVRASADRLFEVLGKKAKITGKRCSPHTMRHTFAIMFLRNGGRQLPLMKILGHTSLAMTNRYVQLAGADMAREHEVASPLANLGKKK